MRLQQRPVLSLAEHELSYAPSGVAVEVPSYSSVKRKISSNSSAPWPITATLLSWQGQETLIPRTEPGKSFPFPTPRRDKIAFHSTALFLKQRTFIFWVGRLNNMTKKLFKWVQVTACTGSVYRNHHSSRRCCGPNRCPESTPWGKSGHTLTHEDNTKTHPLDLPTWAPHVVTQSCSRNDMTTPGQVGKHSRAQRRVRNLSWRGVSRKHPKMRQEVVYREEGGHSRQVVEVPWSLAEGKDNSGGSEMTFFNWGTRGSECWIHR